MAISFEKTRPSSAEMLQARYKVRMAIPCTRNDPTVLQTRSFLDHLYRQELDDDSHLRDLMLRSTSHRVKRQRYRRFLVAGQRLSL